MLLIFAASSALFFGCVNVLKPIGNTPSESDSSIDNSSEQTSLKVTESLATNKTEEISSGLIGPYSDLECERVFNHKKATQLSVDQIESMISSSDGVIFAKYYIPSEFYLKDYINDTDYGCDFIGDHIYIYPPIVGSGVDGDYRYLIHKNNKVQIIKYLGDSEKIVIPEKIDNREVAYIGAECFSECELDGFLEDAVNKIKSVTIPDSVIFIGSAAFYGCQKLEEVKFGKNVICISQLAFYFCKSLTSLDFPESLKVIADEAFGHIGISEVTIPSTIKFLGGGAFGYCPDLKRISFQGGVMHIGCSLIYDSPVEYVYIPKNLTLKNSLGTFNTPKLKSVEYAPRLDEDSIIFSDMYRGCENLTEIKLPENITQIDEYAFQGCIHLKEIHIPKAVTKIEQMAFSQCYSLRDIYFESPDCDGLEESTIGVMIRRIHAPAGGNIEKFCSENLLLKFVPES